MLQEVVAASASSSCSASSTASASSSSSAYKKVAAKKKVRFAKPEKTGDKEKYRKTPRPLPLVRASTRKRPLSKAGSFNTTRRREY